MSFSATAESISNNELCSKNRYQAEAMQPLRPHSNTSIGGYVLSHYKYQTAYFWFQMSLRILQKLLARLLSGSCKNLLFEDFSLAEDLLQSSKCYSEQPEGRPLLYMN